MIELCDYHAYIQEVLFYHEAILMFTLLFLFIKRQAKELHTVRLAGTEHIMAD